MAGGVDNTLDAKRRAERAKIYKTLTEKPAEESRKLAVAEIEAFSKALSGAKDVVGDKLGRWKFFDEALVEARTFVADGDKLQNAQDEPSRVQRRRSYARAYINLVSATDQLDPELAAGSTWVVLLGDAVDATKEAAKTAVESAEKAGEKVAEKAEELVEAVGEGLGSTVTIIAVGVAVALIGYGVTKGRR